MRFLDLPGQIIARIYFGLDWQDQHNLKLAFRCRPDLDDKEKNFSPIRRTNVFFLLPLATIKRIYGYLSPSDRWSLHKAYGEELSEIIYGKRVADIKLSTLEEFMRLEEGKGYEIAKKQGSSTFLFKDEIEHMDQAMSKLTEGESTEHRHQLCFFNREAVDQSIRISLDLEETFDEDDEKREKHYLQNLPGRFKEFKYLDIQITSQSKYHAYFQERYDDIVEKEREELKSVDCREEEKLVDSIKRAAQGEIPEEFVRTNIKDQNAANEVISTIAILFPKLECLLIQARSITLNPLMKMQNLTLLSLEIDDESNLEFSELFHNYKLKYFSLWYYHVLKMEELANVVSCKTLEVICMPPHLLRGVVKYLSREYLPNLKAIGVMANWENDDNDNDDFIETKQLLADLPESLKLSVQEITTYAINSAREVGTLNFGDFAALPNIKQLIICGPLDYDFGIGFPKLPKLQKLLCLSCIDEFQTGITAKIVIATIEGLIGSCPELVELMLPSNWIEGSFNALDGGMKAKLLPLIGGSLSAYQGRVKDIDAKKFASSPPCNVFTLFIDPPEEISFLKQFVPAELMEHPILRTRTDLIVEPTVLSDPSEELEYSECLKNIVMRNHGDIEGNSSSHMYY